MTAIMNLFVQATTSIILTLALAGCFSPSITPQKPSDEEIKQEQAIQLEKAFLYQLTQRARLAEVARPLLRDNVLACGNKTKYSLGLFLHSIDDYEEPHRAVVKSMFETTEQLQILHILKSSPAQGILMLGDIILSINDEPLPKGTRLGMRLLAEQLKQGTPLTVVIERKKQHLNVALIPDLICDYPVLLSHSSAINGYANGSTIIITQGLLNFAKRDNQLALIIAHEMAHNTESHIPDRLSNSAIGVLLDIVLISNGIPSPFIATGLSANLYSQQYEIEADLMGLKLMRKAGYKIENLDQFWQQMGAIHPSTITKGKEISHPTTVERALLIRKEIKKLNSPETPAGH